MKTYFSLCLLALAACVTESAEPIDDTADPTIEGQPPVKVDVPAPIQDPCWMPGYSYELTVVGQSGTCGVPAPYQQILVINADGSVDTGLPPAAVLAEGVGTCNFDLWIATAVDGSPGLAHRAFEDDMVYDHSVFFRNGVRYECETVSTWSATATPL